MCVPGITFQLTVNWKFQLDKTYDEPIVLIQRVEVSTHVYNQALRKMVWATTSYFEVIGTIEAGKTELDRPAGRNYDDTWSLQASEVNSFGEGLAVHLSTGTMVMRGQIRAFKQSDVQDQISGWKTKQTFQGGSGTNTGFPMTSGTLPASQAFYGLWNTKWVESEMNEGKAFVHTETITQSQPTVPGGFSPRSGNPWFPKPHR